MAGIPMRLVCFHHAGGDASLFSGWQHRLGEELEVVPVNLPGRGGEPRAADLDELIGRLDEGLAPLLTGPYLVYGHSLGGLVGYELVRRRAARGLRTPEALFVGAFPAPEAAHTLESLDLDEDALIEFVLEITGMPREVLAYPDWVDSVTTALRDDLAVWRTHRDDPAPRLPCPIHVFAGTADPLVHRDRTTGWAQRTTSGFRLHEVDGGHFFVRDNRAEFLDLFHGVLAEYVAAPPRALPWVLSAEDGAGLARQAARLRDHVEQHPELDLGAAAFALATATSDTGTGSAARPHRAALVATDRGEALAALTALAEDGFAPNAVPAALAGAGPTAFLFTGQGSQRPGMGRELHAGYPVFAAAIEEIAARFDRHLERPLLEVMFAPQGSEPAALLHLTRYAQPALFALETALFRLVTDWGLTPGQVIGHSLGELVAAHVAGVFTLDDACELVAARARLMQSAPAGGAMIAIAADEAAVAEAIGRHGGGRVDVAAVNSPGATVISGEQEQAEAVAAALAATGVKTTRLRVSHAFHSLHMDGILEEFRAAASAVDYRAPRIPVVSNLTGRPAGADELGDPGYWVAHIRRPVRFAQGIGWLAEHGVRTFLELGPAPVLSAFARTAAPEGGFAHALRAGLPERATLLTAVATLFTLGAEPDWPAVFGPAAGHRPDPVLPVDLPVDLLAGPLADPLAATDGLPG
ncbi:acyltransferase domain-containing protein [Kitasatospora sp. NPDC057965]|uniref:acyltransferase domain-containing protein n=1 Tax=Kitasatospora sp. NPDC057965 TaxID=3346291 RepID=UPI0036DBE322